MKKTTFLILWTVFLPLANLCASIDDQGRVAPELSLLPNGKIVSMRPTFSSQIHTSIWRFNPDGSLDTGFNATGKLFLGMVREWLLQPDGQILFLYVQPQMIAIQRYKSDGKIDSSFGNGGVAKISAQGLKADFNHSIAFRAFSDGRLLVAFSYYDEKENWHTQFFRLLKTGEIDKTFGNQGSVIKEGPLGGVFVQKNNAVVRLTSSPTYIEQLDPNGNLDTGFGQSGKALLNTNAYFANSRINYFFQSKEGGAIVAGNVWRIDDKDSPGFIILKFDEKGMPDAQFGKIGTAFKLDKSGNYFNMVMDSKGRFLLVQPNNKNGYSEISRLLPNGKVDKTFGIDGLAIATGGIVPNLNFYEGFAGRDLAAGGANDSFFLLGEGINVDPFLGEQHWKILEKYTESGTLDPDFGDSGRVKFFLDGERRGL